MRAKRLEPHKRKKAILDQARTRILSGSYEAFRLEDLLQDMALSKGGFYHHFKSTHALLVALIQEDVSNHLTAVTAAEQTKYALKGLIAIFKAGASHWASDSGILPSITSQQNRKVYLDILETEFDQPLAKVIQHNFERGVIQQEYQPHNSAHLANMFCAVNTYGNRQCLLKEWDDQRNLDFSMFSLRILSEQLGIGDTLILSLQNTQ